MLDCDRPKATDERVSVGLLSDRVRRQPCDKAASFPKLCIAAIHGLLHLLDGIFVVSALDIFCAPKVIGATNDVRAICGHSVPLLRPECYRTLSHRRLDKVAAGDGFHVGVRARCSTVPPRELAEALLSAAAQHQVCWMAERSQLPPRTRMKVHNSVTSLRSPPSTIRPLARSTILSLSANLMATVA